MKKSGWSAIWQQKQYVLAGTLVIIAAIGTTVYYGTREEKQREQLESEIAAEMAAEEDQLSEVEPLEDDTEEAAVVSSIIPPETVIERAKEEELEEEEVAQALEMEETGAEEPQVTETSAAAAGEDNVLHFSPEDGLLWPMEGNVILNYSMDSTIYFPTLDQYKYNPAVVIAGDVNSKVYSVAKGQITSIENNAVTGTTMTVDLGDGYEAVYGQLKELNFSEGDYVESGHVLGYVNEPTKYYSVEGSNLYFELLKDGEPVNPIEFFE